MADRFTPGPLAVMRAHGAGAEGQVGILDDQRNVVAERWADIRREGEQSLEEAMANARLYAAAPALVKAADAVIAALNEAPPSFFPMPAALRKAADQLVAARALAVDR